MHVLTEVIIPHTDQEYGGDFFMPEGKDTQLVFRAASGDIEAKLQLVKNYLDMVVEIAAGYSLETGRPFSEMVQTGALAIIKAADDFICFQQTGFIDHARHEVIKAMGGRN